jgi:DEAD/DEAH box helicase domain-containing protein
LSEAARLLARWRADPTVAENIAAWEELAAHPPEWAELPEDLHPDLAAALRRSGVSRLYTHQRQTWEAVSAGRSAAVVTGTASGKTLCYNLPVLDALLQDPAGRALYLFPTKALAQDQLSALRGLEISQAPAAIYDGDTSHKDRPAIRSQARLVLSNPDMLHTGILPHHTSWAGFFRGLRFVILDEMHIYRGVFGSHVANVVRRLRRVARFYGADPQFILTSATIANPVELSEKLVEKEVVLIDRQGAGRGQKSFLIYNPPVVNKELGLRRSALQESVRLADDLLVYGLQTIIFARSRRSVELILTYLRQQSSATAASSPAGEPVGKPVGEPAEQNASAIRGYRSGYLPGQRRAIESGLRSGQVRAVVATNALELGIDIGAMSAALLVGYPGSIAATLQQAGRAGRGSEHSLAVLVATADPLDQFLARHPGYFFQRSPEQALVNPDNLLILLDHLRCAAFELPFSAGEGFGSVPADQVAQLLDFLSSEGTLHPSAERYFWMADRYPAQTVSLRSATADSIVLQSELENGATASIGEVDYASALWLVHPGAVYLHEAQSFLVAELNLTDKIAALHPANSDYYTEPRSETTVMLQEQIALEAVPGGQKAYGDIQVTRQVTGFRKIRWHTHEQLGMESLDLPPTQLETTGYWICLDSAVVDLLRDMGLWRGDANDYGPGWERIRQEVRRRDGFRCQACGISEQKREHDVHHKIPFKTFRDGEGRIDIQQANRLENLVTLCPTCHRRVETAVRVRSGLAGLAYALGHLAPLFLMCDIGDLGVHSDPQAPLGLGQPTVVVYDQIPAGIGLSQRLYEIHGDLLLRASELVGTCACQDGCPSCVGPGGESAEGGKKETLAILRQLTGG